MLPKIIPRWEEHPEAMDQALARHNGIVEQAVAADNEHVFRRGGDAFCCVVALAWAITLPVPP
jgi:hypothetical protein